MPFNPAQGVAHKESTLVRGLLAVPFLGLAYAAVTYMDPTSILPAVQDMLQAGKLSWNDSPIATSFYNIQWLDNLIAPPLVCFTPAISGHEVATPQAFSFLADFGVVLAMWLVESTRRSNAFTTAQMPLFFALIGQLLGIGVVSPFYYILYYIFTPIDKFKALDMRLTNVSYTKAILPSLILGYYLPLYASFHWGTFAERVSWEFIWQLFPVWVSLLAWQVLSRFFRDTTMSDRIHNPTSDLSAIRVSIGMLVLHSAGLWFSVLSRAGFSLSRLADIMLPLPLAETPDFVTLVSNFFRFDQVFLFASTFLWLGYLFWDIKHAGMLRLSWVWILLFGAGATLALGPGAAAGLGFLWREELLATRHHEAARTEELGRKLNNQLAAKANSKTNGKNRNAVNGAKTNGEAAR